MGRLTEIANKCFTDKGSIDATFSDVDTYIHQPGHNYTDFYEPFVSKYIGKHPVIFELGINRGGSLDMWNAFFNGDCEIYAIDIMDVDVCELPNIHIFKCDQSNSWQLKTIMNKIGNIKFDIIVDDASHDSEKTLISLQTLYEYVKPNGIYIVEDLHTAFREKSIENSMLYHLTFFDNNFPKELTDSIKQVTTLNKNRKELYSISHNMEHLRSITSIIEFYGENK